MQKYNNNCKSKNLFISLYQQVCLSLTKQIKTFVLYRGINGGTDDYSKDNECIEKHRRRQFDSGQSAQEYLDVKKYYLPHVEDEEQRNGNSDAEYSPYTCKPFCTRRNRAYPPAQAELRRNGVPFEPRRATRLTADDYGKYDLIIGMDSANIRNMHRILCGDPENKIHKLMEYTSTPSDVSDPWYNDRFDIAYRDILKGCQGLLNTLL